MARETDDGGRRRGRPGGEPAGTPAPGAGGAPGGPGGIDDPDAPSAVNPATAAVNPATAPPVAGAGGPEAGQPGNRGRQAGRQAVDPPQSAVRTGVQVVSAVGTGDKAPSGRVDRSDDADPGSDVDPDPDGVDLPDHDVGAVLRIAAFRRLWFALSLSSFGDWLGLLAAAGMAGNLASGSYTAENFAIAGVFILRLAPAVLLGPLAGALADRFDRRWTLVFGDLVRFVLFASIPLVGTLSWLYIATLLIECFALFWMPAKDATVPNLVPRRRLEAANQVSLVATYGTAPLAAVVYSGLDLLGKLAGHFVHVDARINSISVALWFNALTFLFSALTIWNLQIPRRSGSAGPQVGVLRLIVDGWKFVGGTPVVRGLVLGMLGAFAAAGFVIGLAQTFVQDLGAGQAGFGVLFAAVFVGLAAGMWLGPRLLGDFSRRRLFGLSLIMAGVALMGLALVPDIVLATLSTIVVGACGGVAWVTGYTLLGLEVDDEVRGRTFAFLQSAARVVLVLVLALGPALAAPIGTHTVPLARGWSLSYNGAAFVFLLAGGLAVAMGVTSFRQMDDRSGTPLRQDLARAWKALWDRPMTPAARRYGGVFIAFEGGDGAGKSTQVRALASWLTQDQGHEVVVTREPGATRLGGHLRELLLGGGEAVDARTEALLFAADRAHHVDSVIRPALERGAIVVTDRYVDSSIAYQGGGRDLDLEEVGRLSRWATNGLLPDLTVLLDLPPQISRVRRAADAERGGEDRLEALSDEFHGRVRQRFLDLARREPHRYLVLDGSDPREQLQAAIRRRVRDLAPISTARRADLESRLGEEELARQRRAAAESEVRRLDAELRGRSQDEARARQEARRRAREEVERQLLEEDVERRRREDAARLAAEARRASEFVRQEEAEREAVEWEAAEWEAAEREAAEREAAEREAAEREAAEPGTRPAGPGPVGGEGEPQGRPRLPGRPPATSSGGPEERGGTSFPAGSRPEVIQFGDAEPEPVGADPDVGAGPDAGDGPEGGASGGDEPARRTRPGWWRRLRRGADREPSSDLDQEIFGRRGEL